MSNNQETPREEGKFDFSAYPPDTLFYDRRTGVERRVDPAQAPAPAFGAISGQPRIARPKVERRKRIDPTTFDKQYTEAELEFMNAMQQFKVQSGKPFPTHGEVLKVAMQLGYRRLKREGE